MDQAVQKAAVLIEALPYIRCFQGKPVVIKLGGSSMDDEQLVGSVLRDIVFMRVVGMLPVVVHGGGPFITRAMAESGLKPAFVHGQRVTDLRTLEIVERVLLGEVNGLLVDRLRKQGGDAKPLHVRLAPFLRAERKELALEKGGPPADLGYVGSIRSVDPAPVESACRSGGIPVVAPMALGPEGELLNVNADDAAARIAVSLRAEKLVFLSNVSGVLRDARDPTSLFSSLRETEVEGLVKEGIIQGGMLPKVSACLAAVHDGVQKAHILSTLIPHSLLLEIFTDQGIGTQILK
ncbi:MAG: acetylglutamate kinase [Planctomycetes bacterium]|nr:acetylglutamate kinase [Planctomycetota bacterium]